MKQVPGWHSKATIVVGSFIFFGALLPTLGILPADVYYDAFDSLVMGLVGAALIVVGVFRLKKRKEVIRHG